MTRVLIDTMFTYHLVDTDLGVKIFFEKEWGNRIMGTLILKWGVAVPYAQFSCRGCFIFYCFLMTKNSF